MPKTALLLGALMFFLVLANLSFGPAGADVKPAATVSMKDLQFAPADVTINVGDTVLFDNNDTVAHTVTASDKSFDSGDLPAGKRWSYTFDQAGTYHYVCTYHSWMKGTVTVNATHAAFVRACAKSRCAAKIARL